MSILVHTNYHLPKKGLPGPAQFNRWVSVALHAAKKRHGEISIVVVDEAEGRKLNCQYRQQEHATNVLSFSVELLPGIESDLLGDIVICAPIVAMEANAQNKNMIDHYAHMTIHGILHLLGFDHITQADAEKMESLEIKILTQLGINNPYMTT